MNSDPLRMNSASGSLPASMQAVTHRCLSVFICGFIASSAGCQSVTVPGKVRTAARPGAVTFRDVTREAGITFRHHSGAFGKKYMPETTGSGCAFLDADGDGRLDLLAVNGADWPGRGRGSYRPALYRNEGEGTFVDVAPEAGLPADRYGMGVAVGDYDNDGDPDLYLTCLGPNVLLRNRGDARFEDVTAAAGVAGVAPPEGLRWKWSSSAAWLDYDRDGRLDLFVCNYVRWSPATDVFCRNREGEKAYCAPTAYTAVPSTLYRNLGDGRFADVSAPTGIRAHSGKSLGVAVADMNDDGWPDIVVANDMTPNFLFLNREGRRFDEVGTEWGIGVGETGRAKAGMGIDAADWENRGRPGLLIGNFAREALSLFAPDPAAGEGEGSLVDVTYERGMGEPSLLHLTFGLFFFDYDLDGWKDALIGNGHIDDTLEGSEITYRQRPLLFRNEEGRSFREVGTSAGAALAEPMVVRGCARGDVDGDGDWDVALLWNNVGLRLWQNVGGNANGWIGLLPEGTRSNRDGLGARVRVTAEGRVVTESVSSGGSYLSAHQRALLVGLGEARSADEVEIRWPSGRIDRFHDAAAGRYYRMTEGAALSPLPPAGGKQAARGANDSRAAVSNGSVPKGGGR
jgi:hypothetical protein